MARDRYIMVSTQATRAILKGMATELRRPVDSRSPYVCPLCEPGDRLGVREKVEVVSRGEHTTRLRYIADDRFRTVRWRYFRRGFVGATKVPRAFTRLFLHVTDVFCERLVLTTDLDAISCGFRSRDTFMKMWRAAYPRHSKSRYRDFVWVIRFRPQVIVEVPHATAQQERRLWICPSF